MRTGKTMSVREARDQLGRLIDAAHYTGEITIVSRQGEPWAAIVPLELVATVKAEQSDSAADSA
jgi:prevent-host-death family protein